MRPIVVYLHGRGGDAQAAAAVGLDGLAQRALAGELVHPRHGHGASVSRHVSEPEAPSPADDLRQVANDVEVEQLRNQPDFMAFLRELSKEKAVISLQDLRKELAV